MWVTILVVLSLAGLLLLRGDDEAGLPSLGEEVSRSPRQLQGDDPFSIELSARLITFPSDRPLVVVDARNLTDRPLEFISDIRSSGFLRPCVLRDGALLADMPPPFTQEPPHPFPIIRGHGNPARIDPGGETVFGHYTIPDEPGVYEIWFELWWPPFRGVSDDFFLVSNVIEYVVEEPSPRTGPSTDAP